MSNRGFRGQLSINDVSQIYDKQVSSRNANGSPERGRQTKEGGGKQAISSFKRQYLENGTRYTTNVTTNG